METPLHAQKVAILSRLVKETSLTLEEALLLLKQEPLTYQVPEYVTVTGQSDVVYNYLSKSDLNK